MEERLALGLMSSVVYAGVGAILLLIAYKVFDLINALKFTEEIGKGNTALGVVIAGFFIGMAIIVAAAIH